MGSGTFSGSLEGSRLISMLLLADGLVFSSKTCILISHFLLLPCILPSILIVPYWRGSIQYTYNYQWQNSCFPHLLPGSACAQLSRAVDLSFSASSNLHQSCSSQFVSIKSISDSLWQLSLPHDFTLQQFVPEVPCVVFFLFEGVMVIMHFVCRYLTYFFPDPLSCCCP